MRERQIVSEASVPRLPRHVRLQFDKLRDKWVVLAPERVLWPDDISVDILKRCNGSQAVCAIIDDLTREYGANRALVSADVGEFLQDWSDRRLMMWGA